MDVRPLQPADRPDWEPLWAGYLRFYDSEVSPEVTEATWQRIVGDDEQCGGYAAVADGAVVGILHYVVHPTTWSLGPECHLGDLFVAAEHRGAGAARAMIDRLVEQGRSSGWSGIDWITAADNDTAMRLYDRVAHRTTWIRYEIDLEG